MRRARFLILSIGIALPFLSRIPGAFLNGTDWLTSYLDIGIAGVLFLSAFNAICWGSILLATLSYRSPKAVWFPAVLGFVFPAIAHGALDLSSDAQAAIALVFIPIYALPLVFAGWLIGLWFDRKVFRKP